MHISNGNAISRAAATSEDDDILLPRQETCQLFNADINVGHMQPKKLFVLMLASGQNFPNDLRRSIDGLRRAIFTTVLQYYPDEWQTTLALDRHRRDAITKARIDTQNLAAKAMR